MSHRSKEGKRHTLAYFLLVIGILALCILDLLWGSTYIPIHESLSFLFGQGTENEGYGKILETVRLPKVLTCLVVGIGIGISGLITQSLFKNPLAEPGTIGISAGASLGVSLVIFSTGSSYSQQLIEKLGLHMGWVLSISSILGALAALLLLMMVNMRVKDSTSLLVIGLLCSALVSSSISIIQYFANPAQLQEYMLWNFGSVGGVFGAKLWILFSVTLIAILLAFTQHRKLDLMLLGDTYASTLGIKAKNVRMISLLSVGMITGVVTAFCGPIVFIGIIVPQMARFFSKEWRHLPLLVYCGLLGAISLLICDLLAKLGSAGTLLPINAISAMLGIPVLIWTLFSSRKIM